MTLKPLFVRPKILRSPRFFPVLFCIIAIAKFALVANNEIVSVADDSAGYARQSMMRWTLSYPPGYALWLHFSGLLGFPQRIFIEGLYLFSAFVVATGLRKLFGTITACVSLVLLAFAPVTYFLFDHALSDGFFTCLTLMAFGITLHIFPASAPGQSMAWAMGLGGTLGVMAVTRNEDPLIALWILSVICACAMLRSSRFIPLIQWRIWRESMMVGLVTSGMAVSIVLASGAWYYVADGVFARSIFLLPGHVRFLTDLARIDTGDPQLRFIPISRKSREMAYRLSPLFERLRPGVENPGDMYQVASRNAGLPAGEIGGGWIWHAINAQMFRFSGGSLRNTESQYAQMSAELESAFRKGTLRRRFVVHPLLGGDIGGVLRRVPSSVPAVLAATFRAFPDQGGQQAFQTELFDAACLRRSELVVPHPVHIQGWAFVNGPGRRIVGVRAGSTPEASDEVGVKRMERPDVAQAYAKINGWTAEVTGFSADVPGASPQDVRLTYLLDDGIQVTGEHFEALGVSKLSSEAKPADAVLQGIDIVERDEVRQRGLRRRVETSLVGLSESRRFQWIVGSILAISLLVVAGHFYWKKQDPRWMPFLIFFLFTLLLLSARILFYSIVDAASWNADQIRYLAPANGLGVVLVAVSFASLLRLLDGGTTVQAPE